MQVSEVLISRCKEGEQRAFKELYDVSVGTLYTIALRYAKNDFEAQDILQDGFVKVFQSIDKFEKKGTFEGWMVRIVVNTAINYYRKKSNGKLVFDDESIAYRNSTGNDGDAISNLSKDELIEIIELLPDGYRMVLNLYAIEGYSHKEIGDMLGISEGTSRSQLFKSRKMLLTLFEKHKIEFNG